MSLLFDALFYVIIGVFGIALPAVCGAVIALNRTRSERHRLRGRLRRVEAERDGALEALAVIGQVRTNPPAATGFAPVPPGSLATSPVRLVRPPSADSRSARSSR